MNKSNNQIYVRLDLLADRMTPNGIRRCLNNVSCSSIWIYNNAFHITMIFNRMSLGNMGTLYLFMERFNAAVKILAIGYEEILHLRFDGLI